MKDILNIEELTNRQYFDLTNQYVQETKDDGLYSGYVMINWDDDSKTIISEDELNKIIDNSENA